MGKDVDMGVMVGQDLDKMGLDSKTANSASADAMAAAELAMMGEEMGEVAPMQGGKGNANMGSPQPGPLSSSSAQGAGLNEPEAP